jgi:hypothetical protein
VKVHRRQRSSHAIRVAKIIFAMPMSSAKLSNIAGNRVDARSGGRDLPGKEVKEVTKCLHNSGLFQLIVVCRG